MSGRSNSLVVAQASRMVARAILFAGMSFLLPTGTAAAVEVSAQIVDQSGHPIEDAVVVAKATSSSISIPVTKLVDNIVDQVDKQFVPYVKPILVGSMVRFPNKDNIRHHVYSFSSAKTFELPLYSGTSAPPVLFDKPGVVILGCNIHDWMISYVYVAETPYFAKTGADGRAVIKDLPAGNYSVRVWHPRMKDGEESTARIVALGGNSVTNLDWQLALNPDNRIRRAPPVGAVRYR
jgi:plastocyanin